MSLYYNGILVGLTIAYKNIFKDRLFHKDKIIHKDSVNYLECLISKYEEAMNDRRE